MEQIELDITNLSDLDVAAKKLINFAGPIKHFIFNGEMGTGKTTFIKSICKELKSEDNFSSPTYSIVNEYITPGGKIFHFDLYRINSVSELLDLGFEDYIHSKHYCFIEWPELSLDFLSNPYVRVRLQMQGNNRYLSAFIIR